MAKNMINKKFAQNGFQIINDIFTSAELVEIESILKQKKVEQKFGIRAFLKTYPELNSVLFNSQLRQLIRQFAPQAQVIKSI